MSDQQAFDFGGGEAHTRRTDPLTSHQAAATWTETKLSLTKQRVLELFRSYGPMTHEELVDRWRLRERTEEFPHLKEQSIRSRASELQKDYGLIRDTGVRKMMRDGNHGIVWGL